MIAHIFIGQSEDPRMLRSRLFQVKASSKFTDRNCMNGKRPYVPAMAWMSEEKEKACWNFVSRNRMRSVNSAPTDLVTWYHAVKFNLRATTPTAS